MDIAVLSDDFLESVFTLDKDNESFYYFLIDSSNFLGVDSFLNDFPLVGGEYINLYADFSENLKNNGALLYSFTAQECLNNIEQIKKIKVYGGLSLFNSNFEIADIQDHLDNLMEIKQPNGESALFRFQDNFAFHATVNVLNDFKWKQILSYKINYWIWQNVDNCFYRMDNISNNREKLITLSFDTEEFNKINLNLKPLRLMPILKEFDENLRELQFYQLNEIAQALLEKANMQKMLSFEDEILFCTLYHQFGESMLTDGPLKKALTKSQMIAMSFQKATDEIDLEELDLWYKNLEKMQSKIVS
ncbi:DUF4123 domain-containing protein [Acinetobacter pragensis]|uniref:DUF4123 domain-containing protein n=1 Tax=Acinetobacter pragensis TaxID=1806892 RepID=UPI00333E9D99